MGREEIVGCHVDGNKEINDLLCDLAAHARKNKRSSRFSILSLGGHPLRDKGVYT